MSALQRLGTWPCRDSIFFTANNHINTKFFPVGSVWKSHIIVDVFPALLLPGCSQQSLQEGTRHLVLVVPVAEWEGTNATASEQVRFLLWF